MLFVMPFSGVGGGNVKVLHYLEHARACGIRVGLWITQDDGPVDWSPVSVSDVHIPTPTTLDEWDSIFFTWPGDWPEISKRISPTRPDPQIIHIIQHVRHVDPDFIDGYALRLLNTQPFSRICVSPEVHDVIKPHVANDSFLATIPNVIDTRIFHPSFRLLPSAEPRTVLYTNWKTRFGDHIRQAWNSTPTANTLKFESVNEMISQHELAKRLRTADIFIGTPNKTEGFYLTPMEAMASKVVVVCPDVVGNRSFCVPNVTCLMPEYEDLTGHIQALERLIDDHHLRQTIVRNGYRAARTRQWWDERSAFLKFLQSIPVSMPETAEETRENPQSVH